MSSRSSSTDEVEGPQASQSRHDPNWTRFLGFAGAASALAGTSSLGLSVIYDWGFFSALDQPMREVPTTLSDHLRSAVNWMPATLLSISVAMLWHWIGIRLDAHTSPGARAERKAPYRRYLIFCSLLGLAGITSWVLRGDRFYSFLAFGLTLLCVPVAAWLLVGRPHLAPWRPSLTWIALIAPMLLVLIHMKGRQDAIQLRFTSVKHFLYLDGKNEPEQVVVVRTTERGLFVLDASRTRLEFRPWERVRSISSALEVPFQGLLGGAR